MYRAKSEVVIWPRFRYHIALAPLSSPLLFLPPDDRQPLALSPMSSPSSSSSSPFLEECSSPLGDTIMHSGVGPVIIAAAVLGICLLYRKGAQKRQRFARSPLSHRLSFPWQGHANHGRMVSAHQESILNIVALPPSAVAPFDRLTSPLKGKKERWDRCRRRRRRTRNQADLLPRS